MFTKTITIPVLKHVEDMRTSFSPSEKWAFYILAILLMLSAFALMHRVYVNATVLVPEPGGKITEGVIGAPRFVNPVLAISQTDKDLSKLIYAGLMTRDATGTLVPELAESYSISDDALVYTFILRDNLSFHDGTPLTSDDVLFTIEKAMQPGIKSPERANWEGVTIEQVDARTITFTLTKPYAQFLQNTLLGILPQEHWGELSADEFIFSKLNTTPIGSGPYQFVSAVHSASGIPSSFRLARYSDYVRGTPYIKKFTMNFYSNKDALENALQSGNITSMSEVSPHSVDSLLAESTHKVLVATLPRIFAVFFNQSHSEVLEYKVVRNVLRDVIDKEQLITTILNGYGESIDSVLLPDTNKDTDTNVLSIADGKAQLEKAGWELNDEDGVYYKGELPLAFTLTTANSAELKDMATSVAATWAKLGAQVKVEVFEPGNLTQSVLRSREYDALLFGEIVGTEPDLYAFWHSSQRNDPGLNIANYTNSTVDSLLIKARKTVDSAARAEVYSTVADTIDADAPAVFLYAPNYIYITDKDIRGIALAQSLEPHERFANVHLWHIDTKRAWHFLAK